MWHEKDHPSHPGGGTISAAEVPDHAAASCGTYSEGRWHRLCLDRRSVFADPHQGAGEGGHPGCASGRPGCWLPGGDGEQSARNCGPGGDCAWRAQPARGPAAGVRGDAVSLFARVDLSAAGRCAIGRARRLDAADPARGDACDPTIRRRYLSGAGAQRGPKRAGDPANVHRSASGTWARSSQGLVSGQHHCGARPCPRGDDQDSASGHPLPAGGARPAATDTEVPLATAARRNTCRSDPPSAESHAA